MGTFLKTEVFRSFTHNGSAFNFFGAVKPAAFKLRALKS